MVRPEHPGMKALDAVVTRVLSELLEQARADSATLHGVSDEKRGLGARRAIGVARVLREGHDRAAAFGDERKLALAVSHEQAFDVAWRRTASEEPEMNAVLRQLFVEPVQGRARRQAPAALGGPSCRLAGRHRSRQVRWVGVTRASRRG